ncbi:MAG: hypothetical protein U0Q22_09340 [Acidimicrobiales bacterium]
MPAAGAAALAERAGGAPEDREADLFETGDAPNWSLTIAIAAVFLVVLVVGVVALVDPGRTSGAERSRPSAVAPVTTQRPQATTTAPAASTTVTPTTVTPTTAAPPTARRRPRPPPTTAAPATSVPATPVVVTVPEQPVRVELATWPAVTHGPGRVDASVDGPDSST